MRAAPRHPRRPRDTARFDERVEEHALLGGGPTAAQWRGGGGLGGDGASAGQSVAGAAADAGAGREPLAVGARGWANFGTRPG